MNPTNTLRGSLKRFAKYYRVFYQLNCDKPNHDYLGYPFTNAYAESIDKAEQMIKDYHHFTQMITGISPMDLAALEWVHAFVHRTFENKTNHKLAIFNFYFTKEVMHITPHHNAHDPITYTLNIIHKNLKKHEKFLLSKIENDIDYDNGWEPNA